MNLKLRIIRNVALAVLIVFAINFGVLYYLGFPPMAIWQIKKYLPLLVILLAGFSLQIGIFTYYRYKNKLCSITAITGGGVSSFSMILCCSHYFINIFPFISIGAALWISNYTLEILLFGIAANIFGIIFLLAKSKK